MQALLGVSQAFSQQPLEVDCHTDERTEAQRAEARLYQIFEILSVVLQYINAKGSNEGSLAALQPKMKLNGTCLDGCEN